jgi:hypothetical protein
MLVECTSIETCGVDKRPEGDMFQVDIQREDEGADVQLPFQGVPKSQGERVMILETSV